MDMERVVCDNCGQDSSRAVYVVLDTNYGFAGEFGLVQCAECGLVYQNPRPTPEEIGSYYPTTRYHPFRALQESDTPVPGREQQQRAHVLTSKIGTGTLLDVGCGSGLFLKAMQRQGWQVMGVEPNETAVHFARQEMGLTIIKGDIFALQQANSFDLITFWDVLEHTHSPKAVLQHSHHLLRAEGYLALYVPNWASLERRVFRHRWIALDAPRHLYHFTPQTLTSLVKRCGFTIEFLKASAPPLSLSSNLLRWLGDTFYRRGQAKALTSPPEEQNPVGASSSYRHQQTISLVYQAMKLPNALANYFNQGASIMLIARKIEEH